VDRTPNALRVARNQRCFSFESGQPRFHRQPYSMDSRRDSALPVAVVSVVRV
jgi:hypothetical protein